MLDEKTKENIRKYINTICQTALRVIDTTEPREENDLVDRLGQTAEAIAEHYGMESEVMEGYHALITAAKIKAEFNDQGVCFADVDQAKEMIYALCDNLSEPKKIMEHVRTADEMLAVWEFERCNQ